MSYTKLEKQDALKRINTFIKENKRNPNTIRVGKDVLTLAQFLKLDYIADAKSRVVKFKKENGRLPNYVMVVDLHFYKEKFSILFSLEDGDPVYLKFVELFGKPTDFDSALSKIYKKGYGSYYNDKLSNIQTLKNIKSGKDSPNCTDSCQAMWHIAKALGYEVKCIHVQCTSGGHVFLKLKHAKNTSGSWIIRDPACVLSKGNDLGIKGVWCKNGKIIDENPSWFMETLNK